jgi:hypothetical protein
MWCRHTACREQNAANQEFSASKTERQWSIVAQGLSHVRHPIRSLLQCAVIQTPRTSNLPEAVSPRQREILLIDAHYGTVTGSPALLEISRLFASVEPAPQAEPFNQARPAN